MLIEQRKAPRTKRQYVDIDNAAQRRHWCKRLNCNEQQLREAVWAVGPTVEDLRRHLAKYLCIDSIEQRHDWCRRLECDESQLFDAVTAVGLLVEDVRRYLAHRQSAALRRENWVRRANATAVGAT